MYVCINVYVCIYAYVIIKLHTNAQADPVILSILIVILCYPPPILLIISYQVYRITHVHYIPKVGMGKKRRIKKMVHGET